MATDLSADEEYERAMRPLTWRQTARAWLLRLLELVRRFLPLLILALMFAFPGVVSAEPNGGNSQHHTAPAGLGAVESGSVPGYSYYAVPGTGKVYGYGTIPGCACATCCVWQNGRFVTNFKPVAGRSYVYNRVVEDTLLAGGSKAQAVNAASKGLSADRVASYFGRSTARGGVGGLNVYGVATGSTER